MARRRRHNTSESVSSDEERELTLIDLWPIDMNLIPPKFRSESTINWCRQRFAYLVLKYQSTGIKFVDLKAKWNRSLDKIYDTLHMKCGMSVVRFLDVLAKDELIRIEGVYPQDFKIFPSYKLRHAANGNQPVNDLTSGNISIPISIHARHPDGSIEDAPPVEQ